jgi:hypothetical protein
MVETGHAVGESGQAQHEVHAASQSYAEVVATGPLGKIKEEDVRCCLKEAPVAMKHDTDNLPAKRPRYHQ